MFMSNIDSFSSYFKTGLGFNVLMIFIRTRWIFHKVFCKLLFLWLRRSTWRFATANGLGILNSWKQDGSYGWRYEWEQSIKNKKGFFPTQNKLMLQKRLAFLVLSYTTVDSKPQLSGGQLNQRTKDFNITHSS